MDRVVLSRARGSSLTASSAPIDQDEILDSLGQEAKTYLHEKSGRREDFFAQLKEFHDGKAIDLKNEGELRQFFLLFQGANNSLGQEAEKFLNESQRRNEFFKYSWGLHKKNQIDIEKKNQLRQVYLDFRDAQIPKGGDLRIYHFI